MDRRSNVLKEMAANIGIIFFLCVCFFGNNIFMSFATDTYAAFQNFNNISDWMIQGNGRIITGLLFKVWYSAGIPDEIFYYVSHVASVLILTAAVYLLQDILRDKIYNDVCRIGICFLTVANVYIIEYFMFLEKMTFLFAIFLNVCAFCCTKKYFQNRRYGYELAAVMCMLCAVFTYQGSAGFYVILCLPFIYKYAVHFKGYIQNICLVIFNYGIAGTANYLVMRFLLKSSRIEENGCLLDHVFSAVRGVLAASFISFGIIPRYVFVFFLVLILGICILSISNRYKGMDAWLQFGNLLALYMAAALISAAPLIIGSGWPAARVMYPYASVPGMFMINLYVNILNGRSKTGIPYQSQKQNYAAVTVCVGMFIFLFIQYLCFARIVKDKYLNNYMDRYRCMMIREKIDKYEEETGIKIICIKFYQDAHPDLQYEHLFHVGDLVVSSFKADWSDIAAVNYYLEKTYVKGEAEDRYRSCFSEKDWKVFSDEQLIFEGDTLHLCIY